MRYLNRVLKIVADLEADAETALGVIARLTGKKESDLEKHWWASFKEAKTQKLSISKLKNFYFLHDEDLNDDYEEEHVGWKNVDPPLVLKSKDIFIVVDGNHRINQAIKDKKSSMPVLIISGDWLHKDLLPNLHKLVTK